MKTPLLMASDHGGLELKKNLILLLDELKVAYSDLGCHTSESVDYPDFATQVAQAVSNGQAEKGILICGTGIGMALAANKFKGVRAASVFDLYTARMTREHNNLNVLCLGGRVIGPAIAEEIVKIFLTTKFAGDRHQKRLDKINQIEKDHLGS